MVKQLILTVTRQCNLRCSYCPTAKDGWPSLTAEDATEAIRLFSTLQGGGTVKIFGGEPLLVPDVVRAALEEAEQQQALLIDLLAGRDKVQTFLALLNQQALLSGVEIQRYEPIMASPSLSESQPSRSTSRLGNDKTDSTDPLLALGYQKSSVALAVRGPYAGLQKFLQKMESLELLVESSDLEIKAAATNNDDQAGTAPVASRTELTIQLSFYDPQKEIDIDSGNSQEAPPS